MSLSSCTINTSIERLLSMSSGSLQTSTVCWPANSNCITITAGGGSYDNELSWSISTTGGALLGSGLAGTSTVQLASPAPTTTPTHKPSTKPTLRPTNQPTETLICPAGTYTNAATRSCLNCQGGFYQPNSGEYGGCSRCSAGMFSPVTGATSSSTCTICASGSFSLAGAAACLNCLAGFYQPTSGVNVACVNSCSTGRFSLSGASSCMSCQTGTFSISTGASVCTNCQAGLYGTASAASSQSTCESCPAGSSSTSGASSCASCLAGTFQPQTGQASCIACTAGSFCPSSGLTAVTANCAPGLYSNAGATSCSSCSIGTYQPSTGQSTCSACLAGKYCGNTGLSAPSGNCAAGSYSNAAASSCSFCTSGTYSASSSSSCTTCPALTYAAFGSALCSTCAAGTFASRGSSSCAGSIREFDFRGCTNGGQILDTYSYSYAYMAATPVNNPICSSTGISFDGAGSYVSLQSWTWGGATSVELFGVVSTVIPQSRIFDFASGAASDGFAFGLASVASEGAVDNYVNSTQYPITGQLKIANAFSTAGVWSHFVVASGSTSINVYQNGVIAATGVTGAALDSLQRTNHWLGRSNWPSAGYFQGTLAYIRIYNGIVLQAASDVPSLYSSRLNCRPGWYGSGGSCFRCAFGYYSAAGSSSCVASLREWDFRGCTTGVGITDTYSYSYTTSNTVSYGNYLVATPYTSPTYGAPPCSSTGISFNGVDQYMAIPTSTWKWGGSTSIETYVAFYGFNSWSRVFDFANGAPLDNILLANDGTSQMASAICKCNLL